MVYAMHPAGEVQPVSVTPDQTVVDLVDAVDALDLFGDELLDPGWFAFDRAVNVADGARLGAALARYAGLAADSAVDPALRRANCPPAAADAVGQFFAFVGDTAGRSLVIEHLT